MNARLESSPDLWNDRTQAVEIMKEKGILEDLINQIKQLEQLQSDCEVLFEFAADGDEDSFSEGQGMVQKAAKLVEDLELRQMLSGEVDLNDAVLTINAGAGGTESCDWTSMLLRMFTRWCSDQGYKSEIVDILDGDEAGIKNVTLTVQGLYAYGYLKAESGIHRLVRISPFDSNARRHTSFASVYASPIIDENLEIDIEEKDLRIDTYRSQGAGGQHVNTTDSAIRITHNPTGIVVQCQKERSQHQNKDMAMKLLRSKLYEREMQARKDAISKEEAQKMEISFGSQIRSYVLHPYNMVKDHRTNFETANTGGVLDGDLTPFMKAFLINQSESG